MTNKRELILQRARRNQILQHMGVQQWRVKVAVLNEDASESDYSENAYVGNSNQTSNDADLLLSDQQRSQPSAIHLDPLADLDMSGLQTWLIESDNCKSCHADKLLFGDGNEQARWMFVVDAPSSHELDARRFFTGRSGQLFDVLLQAVGLSRSDVYISSIFKCAPVDDLSNQASCRAVLARQIELVAPQVIIAFGEFAAQSLIKTNDAMQILRHNDQVCASSRTPVIPTYSPAQMLDDASLKAKVWQDLKKAIRWTQTEVDNHKSNHVVET